MDYPPSRRLQSSAGIVPLSVIVRGAPGRASSYNPSSIASHSKESAGGIAYRSDEQPIVAVHRLAASGEERTRLGRTGYEAFVRLWSREAQLGRYFEILHATALE